jgi:hypothetical protein
MPKASTPLALLHRWLLLDSRVVDVPMAYNSTFVMLSSLKPLLFNSLNPTTLSRFDMTAGTPYDLPAYYAPYQEAVYVTSVSDDRRRVYDSHL